MDDGAFEASQVLVQSTTDREHQLLLASQMVMAESLSLMEQHSDQQAILDSMGDAPVSNSAGAVVVLSVDLSVGVGNVPCNEPIDDGAFEASQVLLQSTTPISDTPQLADGTVLILPYTGAVFGELTFLDELPAPSLGASSLDGDTALANRVLICPRDECGRHAARQAGDPAGPNLYCCIPSAQLEGHSACCSRVYSQRTLLGEPTGPPPGDDAHPHSPGLAEVGSFGRAAQLRFMPHAGNARK